MSVGEKKIGVYEFRLLYTFPFALRTNFFTSSVYERSNKSTVDPAANKHTEDGVVNYFRRS
jgi:hypothetical protein